MVRVHCDPPCSVSCTHLDNCTVIKDENNEIKKVIQASCNFIGNEKIEIGLRMIEKSSEQEHRVDANGTKRRRKTWPAAKSHGEPQAGFDPWISEWGNPAGAMPSHRKVNT